MPNPELAKAAFSASARQVTGPIKTSAGWVVFNVSDVAAPHQVTFDQVKASLKEQVQKQEAPEALQARLHQFQDAVAGSGSLDKIPADLGIIPAAGSLDAKGMTPDGIPAPIPGSIALRQSIIQHIFEQSKDAQPSVIQGPDGAAFALLVDDVHPGASRSFNDVREQVLQGWKADQQLHSANVKATSFFTDAKKATLAKALNGKPEEGLMQHGLTLSRLHPAGSFPKNVMEGAFSLKVGETGMYQTQEAFWLLNVVGEKPALASDEQTLHHNIEGQSLEAMQADIAQTLDANLMKAVPPSHINVKLYNQVIQSVSPDANGGAQ
ncbi:peptidylprolyl isomerase [Swingsia samuiensis]|uniref:peptidylprolyl isomerase n=1 Tax=Swingsia samuiensis TaxID=1293412 RepID=UPI001FEAA063|nr:peptidyl-prolyl cis-trans isomerase [Swingsia samuiensis]